MVKLIRRMEQPQKFLQQAGLQYDELLLVAQPCSSRDEHLSLFITLTPFRHQTSPQNSLE